MNKISFCSYPDMIEHDNSFAIKNYSNETIKGILNSYEQDAVFFLIDDANDNQWLNSVSKKVKISYDCNKVSLQTIIEHGKKSN